MITIIEKWSGESNGDGSVNGLDAVWNASEDYMDGVVLNAFKFTNPAGCYAVIAHHALLNMTVEKNFDVEFYFIAPVGVGAPGVATNMFTFSKGTIPGGAAGNRFGFSVMLNAAGTGYYVKLSRTVAGVETTENTPATILIDVRTFVRVNYNAGYWKVYGNNVLLHTTAAPLLIAGNTGAIYIGYNGHASAVGIDELSLSVTTSQYDNLTTNMGKIVTAYGAIEGLKNPALTGLTGTAQACAVAAVDVKYKGFADTFEVYLNRLGVLFNRVCLNAGIAGVGTLASTSALALAIRFATLNAYLMTMADKYDELTGLLDSETAHVEQNLDSNGEKAQVIYDALTQLSYRMDEFQNAWVAYMGL